MKSNESFWQRLGFHDWFLNKDESEDAVVRMSTVNPNRLYDYILQKFNESIDVLSFAQRVIFYHEYIICLSSDEYKDFVENKKGIFGLLAREVVNDFYEILDKHRRKGKTVEPSADKWVFRFVPDATYTKGDIGFIGKLLPEHAASDENLRVTFIPRQTGIAESMQVNPNILKDFSMYSEGYYELPYEDRNSTGTGAPSLQGGFARLEAIVPDKAYAGKKIEFFMRQAEMVVTSADDKANAANVFKVPGDWVDNSHLRIKYDGKEKKLYVASFGEKTVLNETEMQRSETDKPEWVELPINSKLMLNGIVGINVFKI